MMLAFAFLCSALGFVGLAASNARYREPLLGHTRQLSHASRIKGLSVCLIGASWALSCIDLGIALGSVAFLGISTIGAVTSVALVTLGREVRSR
jgi:hypothetical protein